MGRIDLTSLIVATGGRPIGIAPDSSTSGQVRVDSRLVAPGDIFWALPGTQCDGHQFVQEAIGRGASLCVVRDGRCDADVPRVVVPDTLRALSDFAAHLRCSNDALIIG